MHSTQSLEDLVPSWINKIAWIPVFGFIVLLLMGFDGLFGQDSYEYIRYSDRLKAYLMGGEFPGNLVWPKSYLIFTSLLSFVLPSALSGQIISFVCYLGTASLLIKTLSLLYSDKKSISLYVVISFLFSGYVFRVSVVTMADSFAIFSLTAAFFFALKYAQDLHLKWLLFFFIVASLGIFSRYAVIVPLFPTLLWVGKTWWGKKQWSHLLCGLSFLLVFLINHHLEGEGSLLFDHHMIQQWSFTHFFENEFLSSNDKQLPAASFIFPNIVFNTFGLFHPGFFFLSPLVLLFGFPIKKTPFFNRLMLFSSILYIVFLSGLIFQSSRYLSLIYPCFLLILFPFFQRAAARLHVFKKSIIVTTFLPVLLLFLGLLARSFWPIYQLNTLERQVAKTMMNYSGQTLYSFELDVALKERGVLMDYRSMWSRKHVTFKEGALVLFNPERINQTFKNKIPMQNWELLKQSHSLALEHQFEQGWKLYKIEQ